MWVTIIADASYCPETGQAGYAFWIASQRGKYGKDGIIKAEVNNNITSEMMALLNALHVAKERGLVLHGDSVLLQTDCQPAIDAFRGSRKNITDTEKDLANWYSDFIVENELHVRWKHVKGHTSHADARFVVNNICDRKARKNMRIARNKHKLNIIRRKFCNG